MAGSQLPLLATPTLADRIKRRIFRPFTGANGIRVIDSDDGVSITLAAITGRGGIGAGSPYVPVYCAGPLASGGYKTFQCYRYNEDNGSQIGDGFEVHARSYGAEFGKVGQEDLRYCYPKISGDYILITQLKLWTGTASVEGWWTADWFWLAGCQVQT